MNPFAAYFAEYVKAILAKYREFRPLFLTIPIGFDGATASQRLTVFTPPVDADALVFGFNVDFSNTGVLVKVTDTSSGYVWNILQGSGGTTVAGTPITAIAGITTQVTPILSLVCPFFLGRQSKMQFDFQNSASGLTTGGNITAACVKLMGPIG